MVGTSDSDRRSGDSAQELKDADDDKDSCGEFREV
jgi:hypothetical protein